MRCLWKPWALQYLINSLEVYSPPQSDLIIPIVWFICFNYIILYKRPSFQENSSMKDILRALNDLVTGPTMWVWITSSNLVVACWDALENMSLWYLARVYALQTCFNRGIFANYPFSCHIVESLIFKVSKTMLPKIYMF